MLKATLQLPGDLNRPARPVEVARQVFELQPPALPELSPELIASSAFAIILSRYSGQAEIPLEIRRASRSSFLTFETTPEATPEQLLESASEQLQEAANMARIESVAGGAAVSWQEGEPTIPSLGAASLNLALTRAGDRLAASLIYDSNRFRASMIARLAGHLAEVLEHLRENLGAPISSLKLFAEKEKTQIEKFCTGPVREPGSELAHQLFERHAAATPTAIALRFRDQELSFGELNARANALAHALIAKGLGAESRVMVCVEPSFDIAVALLAILKAGAVYVPLDPTYPPARIQALLADTKPALLLSRQELVDKLKLQGTPWLSLDEPQSKAKENPNCQLLLEQTAFIYYTSGTTGLPKGAMGSQANLRHYLRVAQERYQICAADVMPAVARFSFSISMFELMSPLIAGGTLLILDRDHVLDPARLSRTLREVTIFHIGPSLLKNLLAYIEKHLGEFSAFVKVRHASSGGDMVSAEILEQLKRTFPRAEVFVIYGCSEVSCMGCTFPATRARRIEQSFVGRPFDNTRVRILDAMDNLVPVGVVGEICISGDGVIKGYLDRPELSAEKFFAWRGDRYYRTGDMGRLSEDGWIEILGRRDFQVQLRGMRIELGEIEHHLRRAPNVKDGVVVAKESLEGEKTLVAYFVPQLDGEGPAEPITSGSGKTAIRQYLREQLPEYMVPSIYVELERLPLNHNLKLDRRSLPDPKPEDRRLELGGYSSADFREPATPTEKHLAKLWRSALGVGRVGLSDHFFDLGGDSLRAIELILKVDAELGVLLEGLEIVRESLGTLAELCDQRRGLPRELPPPADAIEGQIDPIEMFHFGLENSLYGVLHKALIEPDREKQAVLICGPLGPEAVRTNFVLQRLARQLAARGVSTLRFDYFGHGDSLGESVSAGRGRWEHDILAAYDELKRRTGAQKLTVLGARSGAALLSQVLDRFEPQRWVVWDPVVDGTAYVQELARAQENYLRNVRYRRRWQKHPFAPGRIELAGVTYSVTTVSELRQLKLVRAVPKHPLSLRWLESAPSPERKSCFEHLAQGERSSRFEELNDNPGWGDIERVEQTLPDTGISNLLLKMVLE